MRKIVCSAALAAAFSVLALVSASAQPQGVPFPAPIAAPRDVAYPGVITLEVDATDVQRGIFSARQLIPVTQAGPMTLLYPQWLPGKHAPRGQINLFAGLQIRANGQVIPWRRDPVNVYAFHIDVPSGVRELEARYQYVSPTATPQGRITMTREMLNLQWESMLLYPAGHYASQIRFRPSVRLPEGWQFAVALDGAETQGQTTRFAEVTLDHLVDSPMFAGRHFRRIDLDPGSRTPFHLNIVADDARFLEASDEQIRFHRNLVQQAYRLFGGRHYDHYDFLFAVTDRMGGIGIEHQRSSENGVPASYFTEWDRATAERDLLPHELTHSWIGKYRRPADLWTPGFDVPMRGNLLWAYEGADQFWGHVLTARSGLWTRQQALDALAVTAASFQYRVGRQWRSVEDTGHDPILSARRPAPWRSWQRNEDYYSEGLLIWLDADTLIRERTGNRRSLDDFARAFYGVNDGQWREPLTFTFDDVVAGLNAVLPYDWATFLRDRVQRQGTEPPLDGITRGGYRLVFSEERNAWQRDDEGYSKYSDFMYSIGLNFGEGGNVSQVQWDSPAFNQGVTVGTQVVAVNDVAFSAEALRRAISAAKDNPAPISLLLKNGDQYRTVSIDYHDGLRYPRLERIPGTPDRIGAIFAPRSR
ncbi:PDZ domain family protein [alpha proteobacterium U9-1i]|nr:PDZ domain family protein [alpha proteobacterium U9-1i]